MPVVPTRSTSDVRSSSGDAATCVRVCARAVLLRTVERTADRRARACDFTLKTSVGFFGELSGVDLSMPLTEPRAEASRVYVTKEKLRWMDRMYRIKDFRFQTGNLKCFILPILSIHVNFFPGIADPRG